MRQRERRWSAFFRFYTRFRIPWLHFFAAVVLGLVYAEITLYLSSQLILINKGELYNALIISYVLLNVCNALIAAFQNIFNGYGMHRVTLRAQQLVWKKILHLSMREVDAQGPSTLISCVTNDVQEASSCLTMLFLAVSSVYGFLRACMTMMEANAELSLYLLLALPLAFFMFFAVGALQFHIYARKYRALNAMTSFFSQHLTAAKFVKVQGMEEQEVCDGYAAIERQYRADVFAALMSTVQVFLNSIYTNVTTIIIALGGSHLMRSKGMGADGINTFSTYTQRCNQSLAELLTHYQTVKGTQGSLRHVNAILDLPDERLQEGEELREASRTLIFSHVSFHFPAAPWVISDASFVIPQGKLCAFVGENGCGKSTLLKLMQGFYTPQEGTISFGEQSYDSLSMASLRARFAYVLQETPLFCGTIRDNILYGSNGEATKAQMLAASRLALADAFITRLPQGYDTQIGEGGSHLSGGQRQRIALARALLRDAQILLLDEALSALDHACAMEILANLKQNAQGRTIVMVTHSMEEAMMADVIFVCAKGTVIASGTHAQLLAQNADYQRFVQSQSHKEAGV